MALTWTQVAQFASASLPNDITANSVSVAPVSGDATPVGIKLGNGSSTLFSVDASGNVSAAASTLSGALTVNSNATITGTLRVNGQATLASSSITGNETVGGTLTVSGALSTNSLNVSGNETVGGTETVTGLLTANGNVTTPLINTTQGPTTKSVSNGSYSVSNVSLPGSFGDGISYPPSGLSSDNTGNLALNYQGVAAMRMANPGYSSVNGNTPATAFPINFLSGAYNFNAGGNIQLGINASQVKFGFSTNTAPVSMQAFSGNILQLQNGGSSPSFTTQTVGTVDSSGNATFAGALKGTQVTFGDGTTQTTAYTAAAAQNQSKFVATSPGTTTLPAFTYTGNTDTGEYLKTTSATAAVLGISVNASDAMTLTKSGVSIPGTLAIGGATTASGLLTAPNVTLGSNGKLTFGDGTSLTTANAAAANYIANSNGTVSAPSFSFTNNTDTGAYLSTASTTAAVMALSVNAANAMTLTKTGVSIPGTLTTVGASTLNGATNVNGPLTAANLILASSGKITFADGTTQTTAGAAGSSATFTATIANGGSNTAPAFLSTQSANTGLYFSNGPGVAFTVGGTTNLSMSQSNLNIPAAITSNVNGSFNFNSNVAFNGGATSINFNNSAITTGAAVTGTFLAAQTSGASLTQPALNFGSNSSNSGFYYPSSSNGVTCVSGATAVWNATSSVMTTSLPLTATKTVTSTTAAGTPSFVSTQGFKHRVDMGMMYQSSTTQNAALQTIRVIAVPNTTSFFTAIVQEIQSFAGSIIAIQNATTGNAAASVANTSIQIYKNGTAISGCVQTQSATQTVLFTTFAKGTYTFVAGDILTAFVTYSANSANLSSNVSITVEQGA